jgi:cell division protein FtsQ
MAAASRSARARVGALPLPARPRFGDLSVARLLPSGRALLGGFALLAAAIVAYAVARETAMFALRSIEITGAPPRVVAHVRAALRPLQGRSLVALSAGDVTSRLAGLPDVAAVSSDRDFPHTLRVHVIAAHSIAVLRRGVSAWIVSSDGRVVREVGVGVAPKLPRVWIPTASSVDVGSPLADADAARAVRAIAQARRERFGTRISVVRATDQELTFVLSSGTEVRLGDTTSLGLKIAVARRLLAVAGAKSTYVDVSVPTRPIAGP